MNHLPFQFFFGMESFPFQIFFGMESDSYVKCLISVQHSSSLISSIKKRNLVILEGASLAQPGFEPFDFKFLKDVTILDRLVEQTPIE